MNIIGKLLRKIHLRRVLPDSCFPIFWDLPLFWEVCSFMDARSIWEDDDSFIRSDYMVINKRVTSENTFGGKQALQPMNLRR